MTDNDPGASHDVPAQFADLCAGLVATADPDPRIVGFMVGGSVATGTADEYSDLDVVVVCTDDGHAAVLADAREFASRVGPLLVAFTGEHVGEPRLLITLYGPPPQHVDLKFVADSDLDSRVEDGIVLWERDARVSLALRRAPARWPVVDPQWIEDRFWVWVHYVAVKIGRGELFEATDGLAMMRAAALAPLATRGRTTRPAGVRRLESLAPEHHAAFAATVATARADDCLRALRAAADLYLVLRDPDVIEPRTAAQQAVTDFLDGISPAPGG